MTVVPSAATREARSRRIDLLPVISWPLTLALLAIIIYPLARTFLSTFWGDLSPFSRLLSDPGFITAVKNTAICLAFSGTLALLLGAVFAWLNERTDATMGLVSSIAPLVPLLMPPVALSVGWLFLAQERVGYLNGFLRSALSVVGVHLDTGPLDVGTWPGLVWLYTIALVPYAYLTIAPALRNMDTSFEEASRMSGVGPVRTLWRISLPSIGPAIASAAMLIVIMQVSLFSIPRTIGSIARIKTISVYLVELTQVSPSRLDESVALAVFMLAFVVAVWLVQQRFVRRSRHAVISGKATTPTLVRLGPLKWVARAILVGYFLSVSVLPLLALAIVSLQRFWQAKIDVSGFTLANYRDFFQSPFNLARDGLLNSLQLATIGATVTVLASVLMVTYSREVGGVRASLVEGTTKIPAAISHLIIGVALLVAFSGPPFGLAGTTTILLLAYLVIYIPQASLAVEVARGQVGNDMLEASRMSGSTKTRTTGRILLPLMRPGLAYGWAMIFVLIMGDLTASSILSGPGNLVVGAVFLQIFESGAFAGLATLGFVVCLVSAVVVTVAIALRGGRARNAVTRAPVAPSS